WGGMHKKGWAWLGFVPARSSRLKHVWRDLPRILAVRIHLPERLSVPKENRVGIGRISRCVTAVVEAEALAARCRNGPDRDRAAASRRECDGLAVRGPVRCDIDFFCVCDAVGTPVADVEVPDIVITAEVGMRVDNLKSVCRKSRFPAQSTKRRTFTVGSGGPDFEFVVVRNGVRE